MAALEAGEESGDTVLAFHASLEVSGSPQGSGIKQPTWPGFRGPEGREQPAPWQTAEQRGIRNHASVVLSVAPVWTGLPASRCGAGLSLGTAGL